MHQFLIRDVVPGRLVWGWARKSKIATPFSILRAYGIERVRFGSLSLLVGIRQLGLW